MPKLLYHNNCMYLGMAKSGTTTVKSQFDLIKNNESLEIKNADTIDGEYLKAIKNSCASLPKFKLFVHIREPWDRFLSAIVTDIKRSGKTDILSIEHRCYEIRDRYQDLKINDPEHIKQSGFALHFDPLVEYVYKTILLMLPSLHDRTEIIEIWNYNNLYESLQLYWNCQQDLRKNISPQTIKNTVFNYFQDDSEFKSQWHERNQKDIELYQLVAKTKMHSLTCKEYTNLFYEKL